MKKIALIRLTICLILVILLVISSLALADVASGTHKEAEQHFEKANELLKQMDYEAAIAEYDKVIELSSGSKIAQDAQYWIGQSHFRAGRFDVAEITFQKLIETYPKSAIVPVTKLMVERIKQEKEAKEKRRALSDASDKGYIIDPETGVKYTKTVTFAGKNDVIVDTTDSNKLGFVQLSPNGKFLLYKNLVVPLDGSESFELVDISATRCTWSPDGKNVAFHSGDAICIVPVSPETGRPTGPVRKLLNGPYKGGCKVSWSPDGKKLAFRRTGDKERGILGGDIWTLSVKDGSLSRITRDPHDEFGPKWSPDGKSIVYAMRRDRLSFWLISADGESPRKIIEPGGRCIPFWSPDGKWILYTLEGKIHLFGLDDNRELTVSRRVVGKFFSWSPDGKKMLFYRRSYYYKYNIKVVSASGGPPLDIGKQITLYPVHLWTPDSKMIIGPGAAGEYEEPPYGIWISPLSGGYPALIEMDVSVDGEPFPFAVSPNAKKLAFSVKRDDGTEDLFVVPISLVNARTTGSAVKVFEGWRGGPAWNLSVNWSPDDTKLAIIHKEDLWIAPTNGDKPIQITDTPEMELRPIWSPNGKMISYTIYFEGIRAGLYVVPASGGKATRMSDAFSKNFAWSPDSKGITVVSDGIISIAPVAGSKTQQIAKLKDLDLKSVFSLRWSPDGRHIACVGNHTEKGDAGPIFVISAQGGKATTLVPNDTTYKYGLHWSPDGKWISYNSEGPVKIRPEGTIWEADFEEIVKKASR